MPTTKKTLRKRRANRKVVRALIQLEKFGVFQIKQAQRLGLSQPTISRLVKRGAVHRLHRGFYVHCSSNIRLDEQSYAVACAKFGPDAAIGGHSALYFHALVQRQPRQVWVLVSHEQKTTERRFRCLRVGRGKSIGIERHQFFRIACIERALVEALRYSSKLGRGVVKEAFKTAFSRGLASRTDLVEMARALRLLGVLANLERQILSAKKISEKKQPGRLSKRGRQYRGRLNHLE